MAEINCTVSSCLYKSDADKCELNAIKVEPCPHTNTQDPRETDCVSYRSRT